MWRRVIGDGTAADVPGPAGLMAVEEGYGLIPNTAMQLYGQSAALLLVSTIGP